MKPPRRAPDAALAPPDAGLALFGALPLAALGLTALELARIPSQVLDGSRALGALGQLLRSAPHTFGPSAALLALAAVTLAAPPTRLAPRPRAVLLGLLGLAHAPLLYAILADDPSFTWHPATFVATALLATSVSLMQLALAFRADRRALLGALGGLASLAAVALARLHYGVLVGQYPSVHAAAMLASFVALTLGLALLLTALARPVLVRRGALALAALFLAGLVLDPPARAAARPYVLAYTELGRGAGVAEALAREGADLLPVTLPDPRDAHGILRPDPQARARFARHAHLPPLPAGFDLSAHDVLLILVDTARYDRARVMMPNLAALAREGQSFEHAMAPSNGTFASVASMLAMTPVSFAELDVRPSFWRGRLRDERTTAAEAMRDAGRATFWAGHDHRGCFEDHLHGLEQGFDEVVRIHQARGAPEDADVDARIADAAIAALARHRAAGRRSFGLVFFVSPHDDYQDHGLGPGDTDRERYDQELAFADAQLGRLLREVPGDTVVIVAGDHGEAFGEHGHHHHLTSLHDEQIHVPLVVRVPGLAPAVHRAPTSTAYVLPWLLGRGANPERAAAERVIDEDFGPLMRALDGAVLSEMIGPRGQHAALVWEEHTVVYDVLSDLARIYDNRRDEMQQEDLRESRPELFLELAPFTRRYRAARFLGRRFRFVGAAP